MQKRYFIVVYVYVDYPCGCCWDIQQHRFHTDSPPPPMKGEMGRKTHDLILNQVVVNRFDGFSYTREPIPQTPKQVQKSLLRL